MPKLKEELRIVLGGDVYPTTLAAGDVVEGEVADIARSLGKLEAEKKAPKSKASKPPENK